MVAKNNIETILARTTENEQGCWIWAGRVQRDGYGAARVDGKEYLIHRYVYGIFNPDESLEGITLDHLCHVHDTECNNKAEKCEHRRCCNPTHLEPKTQAQHMKDAAEHRTHCRKGHEYAVTGERYWGGRRVCIACQTLSKGTTEYREKNKARCAEWRESKRTSKD